MIQDFITNYNDAVTGLLCVVIFILPAIVLTKNNNKKS